MIDKGYISDRRELVGKRKYRVYYHIETEGLNYLEQIKKEYLSITEGILEILGKRID